MALDLRGRTHRLVERNAPLRYVVKVARRYDDVHGNVSANSITLFAFLALFAVTLLAVAAIGYLDATNVDVAKAITNWLGIHGEAANTVSHTVNTARESARFATMVGFLGVVTIGSSFAVAIATSYNIAWRVKGRGLVDRGRGLVWLLGFGVLGAASIMATTLWTRFPTELAPLVVVVTFAANALLWAFTSWWLPNRPITLRTMLPGVVAGAAMLEVLKVLGGIVVPRLVANASALWGTLGAVFALIAWILFFGRVVVVVTVIEVLEAERRGVLAPRLPGS